MSIHQSHILHGPQGRLEQRRLVAVRKILFADFLYFGFYFRYFPDIGIHGPWVFTIFGSMSGFVAFKAEVSVHVFLLFFFGEFELGVVNPGFFVTFGGVRPRGRGVGGTEGFLLFFGAEALEDFIC